MNSFFTHFDFIEIPVATISADIFNQLTIELNNIIQRKMFFYGFLLSLAEYIRQKKLKRDEFFFLTYL